MNGFPARRDLGRFGAFLDFLQKLRPFAATFVTRSGESSKIVAEGACDRPTFQVALGGPTINTTNSTVDGTVEGCTTGRFLFFGGANTRGSVTGAISFFYAVPANRLLRTTYIFTADERLLGRVRLETLITINGGLVSEAERDFFASFLIRRRLTAFDGDQQVLTIDEQVASENSGGNSDSDDFLGETVNTNIDVNAFLSSEFAVSGDNDLVIRFDYIFSADAKGSLNRVIFSGPGGNGAFSVRNRGITLQVKPFSFFPFAG
ncbi:MAG TPA: hypothetical protein VGR30_20585 [Candidatus Binatia bacterium]|jgi:hypothetical protein|nr:hypothetical protein [Candidatus Binatia bacterium]